MLVPNNGNYSTEDFLRGAVDDSTEDFSPLAIRAKACALHDRAIYVSSQYRVGMSIFPLPDFITDAHVHLPRYAEPQ